MTRVLHLTRDFPPRCTGGISTAVGGMVRASERAGFRCGVLSFDAWRPRARAGRPGAPAPEGGAEAERPLLRLTDEAQLPAARELAAAFRPDLLHVHDGLLWELGAELRLRLGVPAVLSVHVAHAQQNRLRGLGDTLSAGAQTRALREADVVVAPSRAAAEILLGDEPSLGARLHVAGLGVDDDERARGAVTSADRDPALGLCVGRFSDLRGTADLFAVLPRILARVSTARFAVVGGVPENRKGEARWRRRWEAQPPEIRARVEMPGWLAPERVRAYYARAAVLVVPSRFDTFGLVALEGMLHGLGIVATTAGALPELVAHEETGLLCAPGDLKALENAAVSLLVGPERTRRLGTAAAREARLHHLWDTAILPLLNSYRALE